MTQISILCENDQWIVYIKCYLYKDLIKYHTWLIIYWYWMPLVCTECGYELEEGFIHSIAVLWLVFAISYSRSSYDNNYTVNLLC